MKYESSPSLRFDSRVQCNMTKESILAHTRKIIASRAMARSGRLARFLEFTITETLAGHADQLKEFVIGVEVFDRSQDYDPRLDPIVRVEARRLRMKLRKYYDLEGCDDTLRIDFPKGSYAPAIRVGHASQSPAAAQPNERAIAVLPFCNLADDEYEYFSEGLTEEIIHALAKIHSLRVVAWNSSMKLKSTPRDYARIGEQLQVDVVLEANIRRGSVPNTMRIAAQLVSVRDGSYLWAEAFERPCQEIFSVRDGIASGVASALRVRLSPPSAGTHNLPAYHLYLKGRYHWNKRTDEAVALGASYLQQAVELDPEYALAHAGLADCHIVLAKFGVSLPSEAMPKAKAAARRAIQLDPTLAEPHVALGSAAALFDWDWAVSEQHYLRAIELNPGYATAHQWYAHDLLPAVGRLEEAEAELVLARNCDPLSPVILASSAENMVMQRRPEEALEFYERLIELDQYFPRIYFGLARTYLLLGRHQEALDAAQRGTALSPRSAMPLALRAHIYASLGRSDEAHAAVVELQEMSRTTRVAPYLFMRAWSVLDPERACDYLEKACEERDPRMVHAAVSPVFDCLRERPRFDAVLRRMGLSTDHSTVTLTGCSR